MAGEKEHWFDQAIRIGLIVGGVLVCLICAGTMWGPLSGSRLGPIAHFLFERKWVSRGDLDWAGFPVTAYEIAPGDDRWGTVTARYYYSSGSSGGDTFYAQYASPERGTLASMGMINTHGSIIYTDPFLGDARTEVSPDETCGAVDIHWANDEPQCTCSMRGVEGTCLTWWTDEGLFVIISQTLDTVALGDFANSLTSVSR